MAIIEQVASSTTETPNTGRAKWNANDLALDTRVKQWVKAATTAALPANTSGAGGLTLTANANGALAAQDGVTLAVGDDLLVKNEATGANNGIYRVVSLGSVSAPWILTRRDDAQLSSNFATRTVVFVHQGTVNPGFWTLNVSPPIVLGTTSLTWTQFAGGGGGGGYTTIQDEGSPITSRSIFNFTGTAVTAVDNSGSTRSDITVYSLRPYPFSFQGNLTTKVGTTRFPIAQAGTITEVRAQLTTAPTGAAAIIDVNLSGTSIFTTQANRPQWAISASGEVVRTNMDITAVSAGNYFTVDIDQVGSTVQGADLVVVILVRHT
jgi:hypothetical protein